jgi:hypothetical protein
MEGILPNPDRDFTELQWYLRDEGVMHLMGKPTKMEPLMNRMDIRNTLSYLQLQGGQYTLHRDTLRLTLNPVGQLAYTANDDVGFVITGNNPERLARVLKQFGVTDANYLLVQPGWVSPGLVPVEKTDELAHYNLTGPYDWWLGDWNNQYIGYVNEHSALERDHDKGRETMRLVARRPDISEGWVTARGYIYYEDILNCATFEELLRLVSPPDVEWEQDGDTWRAQGHPDTDTNVNLSSMPCDFLPKAFGDGVTWEWRLGTGRIHMVASYTIPRGGSLTITPNFTPRKTKRLTDIVQVGHDLDTDSVVFNMTYSDHVQGFTLRFDDGESPFYPNATVSVGEVTDGSFRPPPGVTIPLYMHKDRVLEHNKRPVPFRLEGMQPLGPRALLSLRRKTRKPVPPRGYRLRAAALRNVVSEEWYATYSKERAYAFDDIVGDLPFPASYQTADSLITALYTSINHAIRADPHNSQHGCTAQDMMTITYDQSTCRYVFECGSKGARIELTMQRKLALLFGFDRPDEEHTTILFARVPRMRLEDPTDADREWSRAGHEIIRFPNYNGFDTLPVALESDFPVTPSLGTENMYVRTNIIADGASIQDGLRSNVLAVVPVDWSKDKASVHMPVTQVGMPLKSNTISSVNIKIEDGHGDNIRFMGHDNLPVTVTLRLSRNPQRRP